MRNHPSTDESALRSALHRMGLLESEEHASFQALSGGVSAEILKVQTSRQVFCVKHALSRLRVAATWIAPQSRNHAEVDWLRFVASIEPDAVPKVLGQDSQSYTFAMSYLDPAAHRVWKEDLKAGRVDVGVIRAVASLLSAIHRGSADREDLARQFATDENFLALRIEPYLLCLSQKYPQARHIVERVADTTLKSKLCLVHGDVSPKNILVGPRGPVLLDAECAWYGDPAFDIAFCLNHLLLKCVIRPPDATRFVNAFSELATEYLSGVSWEPAHQLEVRAAALLPLLLLARVDGKSPVEYVEDEQIKDQIRRFALALSNQSDATLFSISELWLDKGPYERQN